MWPTPASNRPVIESCTEIEQPDATKGGLRTSSPMTAISVLSLKDVCADMPNRRHEWQEPTCSGRRRRQQPRRWTSSTAARPSLKTPCSMYSTHHPPSPTTPLACPSLLALPISSQHFSPTSSGIATLFTSKLHQIQTPAVARTRISLKAACA